MFVDIKQISASLHMGPSTWHEGVAAGIFPGGIKRGSRWSRWLASEVETVGKALAAGASDDELRRLARKLERERQAMKPLIDTTEAV